MPEPTLRGTLVLAARPAAGKRVARPAEDRVPFGSLQQLLDLCAQHERGRAFVRVEIEGRSGARNRRLVLDFGQFSAWPEPGAPATGGGCKPEPLK
jgi:hypothetical protein